MSNALSVKTTVPDILKMSPEAGRSLIEMHEPIMRGPSPLSEGERELIAAYVSGLNECSYCYGVHSEAAKCYEDIPAQAVDRMMADLESAGLPPRILPLMRVARKLTEKPSSLADEDRQAVYEAGWNEQALHDTIMVVSCFNFMNRLLEGHGVHGHEALFKERGPLLKKHGYLPLLKVIGGR